MKVHEQGKMPMGEQSQHSWDRVISGLIRSGELRLRDGEHVEIEVSSHALKILYVRDKKEEGRTMSFGLVDDIHEQRREIEALKELLRHTYPQLKHTCKHHWKRPYCVKCEIEKILEKDT